jgi:hypothetical protein
MSGVATAIVGVAAAGATVYAANSASRATNRASNAAIQGQREALAQQERLAAPYTALGQSAIPAYQALLGLSPDGTQVDPKLAQETLRNMPGYQFAQQEGQRGTLQAAGAMGMGLSGNTLAALDRYNVGLADQTYQDELRNLLAPVGIGQAAASGQAANVGTSAANIGNIQQQQGVNLANIGINRAAGITNAIGQGVNQYVTQNTLRGLQGSPASIQSGWNRWQDPTQFMNTPQIDIGGPP